MADTKISGLAELTTPATDDELRIVDKSDTSMAASGTDKRITAQTLAVPTPAKAMWLPANGIAETMSPFYFSTTSQAHLSTGRLQLAGGMVIPKGVTCASVKFLSGSTGLSVGVNQWGALFDRSYNKLAISADATSAAWGTDTLKTFTFTTPYLAAADIAVFAALLVVATTVPTMRGVAANFNAAAVTGMVPCGGNSNTGLTNPASCPNPCNAPTQWDRISYAQLSTV